MAVRKKTRTKAPVNAAPNSAQGGLRIPWAVLFWLVFALFIFGLFLFNRENITNSIQTVRNETAVRNLPAQPPPEVITNLPEQTISVSPPQVVILPPEPVQVTEDPQAVDAAQSTQVEQSQQAAQGAETDTRERALYFIQVDRVGAILRVRAERSLPVSNSPMTDVIHALIAGPSAEESRRGLISLIPPETRMLSATVRGNTAYISFNEDFQYNTYGVEGYVNQLRQIVFTVTEFPNVNDVQILIEGRRVDFLGEGVWIGSPLSRDML